MVAVVISIFLIGGTVIGLFCFIENSILEQNKNRWSQWEKKHTNQKRSA